MIAKIKRGEKGITISPSLDVEFYACDACLKLKPWHQFDRQNRDVQKVKDWGSYWNKEDDYDLERRYCKCKWCSYYWKGNYLKETTAVGLPIMGFGSLGTSGYDLVHGEDSLWPGSDYPAVDPEWVVSIRREWGIR